MKSDSGSLQRLPWWLVLVAAMSAVGPVSIDMYLPAFPVIEHEFGVRGVERTMAAYLMGIAIGQLFYGPLSDRFGRKPPLYFGLVLYAIGSLGCALADSMTLLLAMRVLQALGACAGMVIGRAIVRDRCEAHEAARAFSILMLIIGLGPVIAPAVGGWVVTALGWRAIFAFQCLLGVVLVAAIHRVLRESRPPDHVVPLGVRNVVRRYVGMLGDAHFVGYALTGGFGMAALFCYVTGSSNVLSQQYGLTPQQFGMLIGLNGVALMIASRLNLMALRRIGPARVLSRVIIWPLVIALALVVLTAFTLPPLWLFVTFQLLLFISIGRVNPNAVALALAGHGREAGSAAALLGAVQSTIATLASLAVAVFTDGTVLVLVTLMAAAVLLSWVSHLWVRRLGHEPSPTR